MKTGMILLLLFLYTYMAVGIYAQEMPLVYDVENTGAGCPAPYLYSYSQLPVIQALPDPFVWCDGRGRIANFSDWRYRRAEISAQVQHYELGVKPAPPDSLEAGFSNNVLTVTVTVGGNTLTLTAPINLPQGDGPFPAVIGIGWGTGSLPSDIFTGKGIATIQYNFGEVAPWTQSGRGQGAFYQLYPDTKVGYFTAWAWGVSRLLDGLEKVPQANIDLRHLAITGCSFAGKIALFSGAFDERIALTIPQEPGGGGDAAWRVTETLSGSRETLSKAQSYGWYYEDINQFNNSVTKLPFDHHEVMALIAPRALFVLGNPDQEWLADESGYVACMAALEIWNTLGVPERFGFSKVGGHDHCRFPDVQRPDLEAFVDKFLLGKDTTDTIIRVQPGYTTNLASWIKWTTPALANDTSFFGRADLIYPPNLQTELDTSITFKWNDVEDAEHYYFQLSTDPAFKTAAVYDSTTDTVRTVSGLSGGRMYYWRIRVKNNSGSSGPWSDQWNFSTYIALPAEMDLVSAEPLPNRSDYIILTWRKVKDAGQYLIQLASDPEFVAVLKSVSAADTVKNVNGMREGQKYYWRVQANNIAGSGPWSEVWDFTIIIAPTDLILKKNTPNEIMLSWQDNSAVEDGYIIERKQGEDTSFSVIDTLQGSGNEYVDEIVEVHNYTYRVKAYKDSAVSAYSNEAAVTLTGIINQQGIPKEYSISQNFPNPFNPVTKIIIASPKTVPAKIMVYDILGREIGILINKTMAAGYHEISVDAADWPSGLYFYRIQAGDFIRTKKMILMK